MPRLSDGAPRTKQLCDASATACSVRYRRAKAETVRAPSSRAIQVAIGIR